MKRGVAALLGASLGAWVLLWLLGRQRRLALARSARTIEADRLTSASRTASGTGSASASASTSTSTSASSTAPRRRLNVRCVTVSAKKILVDDSFQLTPSARSTLPLLGSASSDLYVIVHALGAADADAERDAVAAALSGLVDPRRVLVCATAEGKAHMARHVGSQLHIDTEPVAVKVLQQFIPHIFLVETDDESDQQRAQDTGAALRVSSLQDVVQKMQGGK